MFYFLGAVASLVAGFFALRSLKSKGVVQSPAPLVANPEILESAAPVKDSLDSAVIKLATALAGFETGARNNFILDASTWKGKAARNKNPLNLRSGKGQTGTQGGYAVFPSEQIGWEAGLNDVRSKITGNTRTGLGPGSTLKQFVSVFAPPSENPTSAYLKWVSDSIGIGADVPFRDWVAL